MKKTLKAIFCIIISMLFSLLLTSCVAITNDSRDEFTDPIKFVTLNYWFPRYVSCEFENTQTGGRYYDFDNKYGGLSAQLYKGGGKIIGETEQIVEEGNYGTEVTAVPNEGFVFIKWSDGITTPYRKDTSTYCYDLVDSARHNVKYNSVYPLFAKKYTINFAAMTGGYIDGELSQTIATGESGTLLTAFAENGYTFTGWYCEDSDGWVAPGSLHNRITDSNTLVFDPFKMLIPNEGRYIVATFIKRS